MYNITNIMANIGSLSDSLILGTWKGTGSEVYCEVNETKIEKIGFNIEMKIKKASNGVYRVETTYSYSKTDKAFGLSYEKGDKVNDDDEDVLFFNSNGNGLFASGIWNKKDSSSRTVEFIHFKEDDLSTMFYNYNTNEVVNPLNAYFKKVSSSVQRWTDKQSGKILVSGRFELTKK